MTGIPAYVRLKQNRDFGLVYRRGHYCPGRYVVLHTKRTRGDATRLGVTVSKKVRGAVLRNRLKRRLREAFRQLDVPLQGGVDLILTAKEHANDAPFPVLTAEIAALLHRAEVVNCDS